MERNRSALVVAVLALAAGPACAAPVEVSRAIPDAQEVGAARYHLLTMSLFDATLYNAAGDFSWNQPFALTLTYHRAFSARALTNRSLREMSERGGGTIASLEPLRAPLQACMPDIERGDRVTGVSTGPNTARFYYNGRQRCEIEWPGFRRSFFGIWLAGRDGPAARLSAQLRGEAGER